jgi:cytolysin-activating lysine-acyltransferase
MKKNKKDIKKPVVEIEDAIVEEKIDNNNEVNQNKGISSIEGVLGSVSWIMTRSPFHKHLFITDLEWLVIPPIMLRQMRLFRNEKMPLAYISWAYLSEEAEKRFLSGAAKLAPKDWKSGNRLWIVDNISLKGSAQQFLKILQEQVFKKEKAKILRPKKDGKGVEGVLLKDFLEEIKKK